MNVTRSSALRLIAGVCAIAVIAAALVLIGRLKQGSSSAKDLGALDARNPALDQPAPNFALSGLDGQVTKLSDLRGQIVLVNFWATWCVPCRDELPAIEQVYNEQRGQGFTVLEVNEQEQAKAIKDFSDSIGTMPPVVLDRDGGVMQQYRLKGLPDSFVVDRQGIVRGLSYGPVSRATILKYIDTARQAAR
jgi:cytochrome c biogenesis protein CcmG, thiol:disulfide interchange protein DsbE